MMPFTGEYVIDTEIQDFFGENGSLLSNSVIKQVEAPPRPQVPQIEFISSESLRAAQPAIEVALSTSGVCMLRYTGTDTSEQAVEAFLPDVKHALGIKEAANYEAAGGSDHRPAVGASGAVAATNFPAGSFIPPHHELMYTPSSPDRVAFMSIVKASEGGETTVYDGVAAMEVLRAAVERNGCPTHLNVLTRCESGDRIVYRRVFHPPGTAEIKETGNTICDWVPLFGDVSVAEATEMSIAMGFNAKPREDGSLQLDFASDVVCKNSGALNVSATAQGAVIYDVFYRDGSAPAYKDGDIWWESDNTPVTKEHIMVFMSAYCQARVNCELKRPGDTVLLCNRRMAHGRTPFNGDTRKTAVVIGNI